MINKNEYDHLPNSVLLGVATLEDLIKAANCDPSELKKIFDCDERLMQKVSNDYEGFPYLDTWRMISWFPASCSNRAEEVIQIGSILDIEHRVRRIFNDFVFYNGSFFPTLEEDPNKEEALGVVTNLRIVLYAMVAHYLASNLKLRAKYSHIAQYEGDPEQTINKLLLMDERLKDLSRTDAMAAHYLRRLVNGFDFIAEGRVLVLNAEQFLNK